jgi:AraC family transcriptional activator of pobA
LKACHVLRANLWRHTLTHSLDVAAVFWVSRGNARAIAAATTYGLGPNACLVVPPGVPFSIEPGVQMQGTLLTLPAPCSGFSMTPVPDRVCLLRVVDMGGQAELSGLMDRILAAQDKPGPGQCRAIVARAMLVSAWISRLSAAPAARPTAAVRLAERFAAIVEARFHTGATLADLGADLDVTSTHLTRTLRATCAMSAAAYLNERVMHAARSALWDTQATAAAISRDLGFSSPAYFSRAFTAHSGLAPGAFRAARPVHLR